MKENNWKYVKNNISRDDLVRFEKSSGIHFDEKLCDFILRHNNGRPEKNCFDTDRSKERVFSKLLSFNSQDKENVFSVFESGLIENEDLVAIASDPFGNFICLDKNDDSIVVFWNHDDLSTELIKRSFMDFIGELY